MLNLLQAQTDIYQLLLSSAQLINFNIVLQREMQLQAQVNVSTVWLTPRNGYSGVGIIAEMPTAACDSPNVAGPVLDWVFSIHVLEVPNLNFAAATTNQPAQGTLIPAETIVQMILDEIQHYADENLATFKAARNCVQPANIEGIAIGYRLSFTLEKGKSNQTTRTGQVQHSVAGGSITLSDALDPSAPIYYTLDGTFPSLGNAINPSSTLYTAPVTVTSGQIVRARAYATNKIGSATTFTQI